MKKLFSALALTSLIFVLFLGGCDNRRQGAGVPEAGKTSGPGTPPAGRNTGDSGTIVEGTINGGGGRGVRCKGNGRETLEFLDLFEARALGATLLPVPTNEEAALDLAIDVLARHAHTPGMIPVAEYAKILKVELKNKWLSKFRFLKGGETLRMIDDSHEVIKQAGCEAVQLAVYYESMILIDKKLWDQLDNLSKAAVWIHELVYQIERQAGRTNSISTRILVGQLFSTKGSRARMSGIPEDPKKFVLCGLWEDRLPIGSAYAYDSGDDYGSRGIEIVFEEIPGTSSIMRKSVSFQNAQLNDLESPEEGNTFDGQLEVDSLNEDRTIRIEALGSQGFNFILASRKSGKTTTLNLQCSKRLGVPRPPPPSKVERKTSLPVGPPPVPHEVELKSRYDDVGTYEETATYSFRFMSHDVELTRNNWDLLFEARKDFGDDRFEVNTVTDDDSFIFDIKSAEGKCESADPCEIAKNLQFAKDNSGQKNARAGEGRTVPVAKGHCYLVASQDRDGSINALFEVKDHVKSTSAVIHKIKVLNAAPKCEK